MPITSRVLRFNQKQGSLLFFRRFHPLDLVYRPPSRIKAKLETMRPLKSVEAFIGHRTSQNLAKPDGAHDEERKRVAA